MPIARFLEMLGHLPLDVLVLSNRPGPLGRWTMGGPDGPVPGLRRIKQLLAQRGIVPRCYLGSSAGGEAAMVAASLDRGSSAITLAGRIYGVGRSIPLRQAPPAFVPLCECWPDPAPIHAIFNADEPLDRKCHQALKAMAPHARLYPIPGNRRHNPMTTLAARGKLRAVMVQIGLAAMGQAPDFDVVGEPWS